jgi:hypothetical protein
MSNAKRDAEQAGVTSVGFNIAVRLLATKEFIEIGVANNIYGKEHAVIFVTDKAWNWIEANESQFIFHRAPKADDLPF